ncbi:MAG: hypothetical protein M3Q69_08845 [Acidobacteriota bacterium]|nr:hypothetical protein [Acidobacteriota bacterium]
MKRLAAILACALTFACSSGGAANGKKTPAPEVRLFQLTGPAEQNYPTGAFEVQIGVRIINHSDTPMTLRQIALEPFGEGGIYRVTNNRYFFTQQVGAQSFSDMTFWARAYATGNSYSIDAQAPVSIRATAHFDSANGPLRRTVTANFNARDGR